VRYEQPQHGLPILYCGDRIVEMRKRLCEDERRLRSYTEETLTHDRPPRLYVCNNIIIYTRVGFLLIGSVEKTAAETGEDIAHTKYICIYYTKPLYHINHKYNIYYKIGSTVIPFERIDFRSLSQTTYSTALRAHIIS